MRDLGATKYPEIDTVYSSLSSFQGYAGYFDDATIAEIRNRPEVSTTRLKLFNAQKQY